MSREVQDDSDQDASATTRDQSHTDHLHSHAPGEQMPRERFGRYAVLGKLGRGGFAEVFLAHDEQLDRQVALKLPRADRFRDIGQLATFMEEARTAARLQHPGIVKVFDVGVEGDTPFIVLEYIRGRSLAHLLEHEALPVLGAARIIAEVAEALAHAHEHGFVHRDIKPQNILLDIDDRPHIADFGLAVRHRDPVSVSMDVAGTTHYMSPEQVRGENHRIDARTDLWAMGVVLYRALTGRLPFNGGARQEVYQQIVYKEPVPPREIDPTIPAELERICLHCLCHQMSSRYRTAKELANELDEWIQFASGGSSGLSSTRRRNRHVEPPEAPVVPRGLRSFTQEDRDFFLKLIPGPRDREGLPAPVRFWKTRIEEREPEETFNVGILYGPSGCGKSSLIMAGVLPRLHADVEPIYVDATSLDTEGKLLRLLRRKYKSLPHGLNLTASLRLLREEEEMRSKAKVLLIVDQFEQWLHRWQSGAEAELVQALLQCDGGNVQCILMVRDDFWLPVSRFMRELEISIVDGANAMLVDSFDPAHARHVLRELGIAYHRLPPNLAKQTDAQTAFISQATQELAEDNRLFPIRLAVFVEMVKDCDWTPQTLHQMGGAQGIGISFLESSVGSQARSARRAHEQAARGVLEALLPASGQIKDSARTRSELLQASGYTARPHDFDELIHLLDVELRLLTPAKSNDDDRKGELGDSAATASSAVEPAYQLTHDFLIPSIRAWLELRLRETRRGRAALLLQEQAQIWNARPSTRALPSLLEWAWLRILTEPRAWTRPQRRMMQAARRRLVRQAAVVSSALAIALLVALGIYEQVEERWRTNEATVLVSKLSDVGVEDLPTVMREMEGYRNFVNPLLQKMVADSAQAEQKRIRAAIALLPVTDEHSPWLTDRLIDERLPMHQFLLIRKALKEHSPETAAVLRGKLAEDGLTPRQRLRIAVALAAFDVSPELWKALAVELAVGLLHEPTRDALDLIEALQPARAHLVPAMIEQYSSIKSLDLARLGALAIDRLSAKDELLLAALLPEANPVRYRAIVELLRQQTDMDKPLAQLNDLLLTLDKSELDSHARAAKLANVILALHELGDDDPFHRFAQQADDPRVRSQLIHAATPERMDVAALLPLMRSPTPVTSRFVAMSAAFAHLAEPLPLHIRAELTSLALATYRDHAAGELHSIAGLLLSKLDAQEFRRTTSDLANTDYNPERGWFVNKAGQTMIVLRANENDRQGKEIPAVFAISATEITLSQFKQFLPNYAEAANSSKEQAEMPVAGVVVGEVLPYCNYLNQLELIPEDQWCYSTASLQANNYVPESDYRNRGGYRLPTDAEWEFACRAGSRTPCFFGDDPQLVRYYAWDRLQSGGLLQPVANLLPNPWGLCDIYGNANEMTMTVSNGAANVFLRGGSIYASPAVLTSQLEQSTNATARSEKGGFRVVRTIKTDLLDE